MNLAEKQRLMVCLDLTSLNTNDTPAAIEALCQKAINPLGAVAAVCIYPQFVSLAWQKLIESPVKIATVTNFPHGNDTWAKVALEIQQSIADGAAEIDVVIPYHEYAQQNRQAVREFVASCKRLCGEKIILKTILETGALSAQQIQQASEDAIAGGADFLKTSTGKITTGATIEAAAIMLSAIKQAKRPVGFKAAGGIRTLAQAQSYVMLAQEILQTQITPNIFRIGASSLIDVLCETI